MAWKDLKKFWFNPSETNRLIETTIEEVESVALEKTPITIKTAIGYAIIESAKTRPDSDDVIHLVIGSYDNWTSEFIEKLIRNIGYKQQRVVTVVPEFLNSFLVRQGATEVIRRDEVDRLKGSRLASIYVYSHDHMFNWEYYDLDLSDGGYLIFDNVVIPEKRIRNIPGWTSRGRFCDLYFLRRNIQNDSWSNDSNQGEESESTKQDI